MALVLMSCGRNEPQTWGSQPTYNNNAASNLAKDFKLTSVDGDDVQLSSLKGKVVLLHFFSAGCPTCAIEARAFQQRIVGSDLSDKCVVLGISIKNAKEEVLKWRQANGITYKILLDSGGKVFDQFKVSDSIPTLVYLDKELTVKQVEDYYAGIDRVLSNVQTLINASSGSGGGTSGGTVSQTEQFTLIIEGMDCPSCAKGLEKSLKATENIVDATVDFPTKTATITTKKGTYTTDSLIKLIKDLGYDAHKP